MLQICFITFRCYSLKYKPLCIDSALISTLSHLDVVFSLCLSDCFSSPPLCSRADVGEIYTTIPETGLTNRIISLFEHAIQSENGTHCPLLWRMYLNFLVRRGCQFYCIYHIWNFSSAQYIQYHRKKGT